MATIGTLVAELSANTAAFHNDLGKAAAALNSSAAGMNRSLASIERGFMNVARSIGAVAGPAAMGVWVKSQIDAGDALNKLKQKTGVAVERLSAYQYAAKLADVDNGQLEKGLVKLAGTMNDAVNNKTGEAARTFEALGIKVQDATGKMRPVSQILEEIGRKFKSAADGTEKTIIASTFFGEKVGASLIPLLNQLDELVDQAQKSGKIISTDFAQAAERFNDQLTVMTDSLGLFLARGQQTPGMLEGMITFLKGAEAVGIKTAETFEKLGVNIGGFASAAADVVKGNFSEARNTIKLMRQDIDEITKRSADARAALFTEKPAAAVKQPGDAAGGLPTLKLPKPASDMVSDDSFKKMLESMKVASAKAQVDMLNDETDKSNARIEAARQEWVQKAQFAKLSTEQQTQFLKELDDYQLVLRQVEGARLSEKQAQEFNDSLKRYEQLRAQYDTEFALQVEQDTRLAELDQLYKDGAISREQDYQDLRNKIIQDSNSKRMKNDQVMGVSRLQFDKMTWGQQLAFTTNTLQQLTSVGANESKKQFEMNKKAGIANAIVSTYQGAAAALAWGFPLGPIFAALVIAAGLAQIRSIKSATFGGSTSPASIGGGGATPVYEPPEQTAPTLFQPNDSNYQGTRDEMGRNVNVTFKFEGSPPSDEWLRDHFMPRFEDAVKDGAGGAMFTA